MSSPDETRSLVSSRCPCLTDLEAEECCAPSPSARAAQAQSGSGLTQWGRCTRGKRHTGDHIRCCGGWSDEHAVERWQRTPVIRRSECT